MTQPMTVQTNPIPVGVDAVRTPFVTPPTPPFPDLTDVSTAAAITRSVITATFEAAWRNWDTKTRFLAKFADYVTNMESGQTIPAERRVPPVVPMGYGVLYDGNGMAYVAEGVAPVCDMPPLPYYAAGNAQPNATPNMIMLGNRINGNWFQALKGDTFPNGQTTPPMASADGVFGVFEKFGAPVGPGWYLKSA